MTHLLAIAALATVRETRRVELTLAVREDRRDESERDERA